MGDFDKKLRYNDKKTVVFYGSENAVNKGVEFMRDAKTKMDITFDNRGPSIVVNIPDYFNGYKDILNRGGSIRCITEITKENVEDCIKLMDLVTELRHMDGMKGGIAITDTEYMATTVLQKATPLSEVIYSSEEEVVAQGQYVFDTFWNNAILANKKIKEITEGIQIEVIKTTMDSIFYKKKLSDLLDSAQKEVLFIISSVNENFRQLDNGTFQKLKEIKDKNSQISIRILTPFSDKLKEIYASQLNAEDFCIRYITTFSEISILIVDRKYSLISETKNDLEKKLERAIGMITYTNSAPTVTTYGMIFDILWKQTDLYQQLENNNRIHKEFVDIIIHELSNPIHLINGFTQHLLDETKNIQEKEMLFKIISHTKNLKFLIKNLSELTSIEANIYSLKKEYFDINKLIFDIIDDFKLNLYTMKKNILFEFESQSQENIVFADPRKISQVLSNLINNSCKFVPKVGGLISISVERKKISSVSNENQKRQRMTCITIRDNGEGLDPNIMPILFSKFKTYATVGTGLGLYISKNIIDSHGGRIFATNNINSKGASFSFTLPIDDSDHPHD